MQRTLMIGLRQRTARRAVLCAGFLLVALLSLGVTRRATAQDATPPAPGFVPQQAPVPPAAPSHPEFFGALGRFLDQSIANVGAGVKGAGETLGGATSAANDIAKGVTDAAGSVVRLPSSNVVAGWQRCAVAPNGAPDCVVASETLCRAKGYGSGRSVDITTAQKCPAGVWISGRQPTEAECTQESFVSRALCQ